MYMYLNSKHVTYMDIRRYIYIPYIIILSTYMLALRKPLANRIRNIVITEKNFLRTQYLHGTYIIIRVLVYRHVLWYRISII